jgi:hypothetical protein
VLGWVSGSGLLGGVASVAPRNRMSICALRITGRCICTRSAHGLAACAITKGVIGCPGNFTCYAPQTISRLYCSLSSLFSKFHVCQGCPDVARTSETSIVRSISMLTLRSISMRTHMLTSQGLGHPFTIDHSLSQPCNLTKELARGNILSS